MKKPISRSPSVKKLISSALAFEKMTGINPSITSAVSEYDAMKLVRMSDKQIRENKPNITARKKGYDFKYKNKKYQIKASRPSLKFAKKDGVNKHTLASPAKNFLWTHLFYLIYDRSYNLLEAYKWTLNDYKTKVVVNETRQKKELTTLEKLGDKVRPKHYKQGKKLF